MIGKHNAEEKSYEGATAWQKTIWGGLPATHLARCRPNICPSELQHAQDAAQRHFCGDTASGY